MVCEQIAGMVIGVHKDSKGVIGDRVIDPLIRIGLAMIKTVVEILDHLMSPGVCLMKILDTGRILPKTPRQLPQLGMIDHRLVVNFRPHLAFVATDRIPVKFIALDLVYVASHAVPDPSCPSAVDFH